MIKKILKWTAIVLLLLIGTLVLLTYANQNKVFDAPIPDIKASTDSAVIARGEYLVLGAAHCNACHSPLEYQDAYERGENVPLSGGRPFKLPVGTIYSANLTSDGETGLGNVSDQLIARTLRHAVGYDGRVIPDFMPFQNISDDDLTAIVSYIRTLAPVKNKVERYDLNFLGKFVKAFVIKPIGPKQTPPKSVAQDTSAEYGKYLVHYVSECRGCHTLRDERTGAYIGKEMAGGAKFPSHKTEGAFVVSPNLTPDPETGRIFNWSQEQFISRFRQGQLNPHSPMPWVSFKRLTDNDLKAIYNYLKTIEPVKNKIEEITITANK